MLTRLQEFFFIRHFQQSSGHIFRRSDSFLSPSTPTPTSNTPAESHFPIFAKLFYLLRVKKAVHSRLTSSFINIPVFPSGAVPTGSRLRKNSQNS